MAGLLIAARVTLALGSGDLDVPLTSTAELVDWIEQASPATLAMALLRLGVLVGIGYLLLATLLTTLAEIVHLRPLTALADRVTPSLVRRIAHGGGGVGLALGAIAGTLALPDSGPDRPQTTIAAPGPDDATMSRAPGPEATMTSMADVPASTATMTRSDPPGPAPDPSPPPPTARPGPAPPSAAGDTWVVEAGDSFWSIAEDVVGSGDERAVERYWRALIGANRSRLADPENPDLLIPGQVLVLVPYLFVHFSVDGTLLEAWASHKSFKPKHGPGPGPDGPSGRNVEVDFRRAPATTAPMPRPPTPRRCWPASPTTPWRGSATPGICSWRTATR